MAGLHDMGDLSAVIKGVSVTHAQLVAAMDAVTATFTKAALAAALVNVGVSEAKDGDVVRRLLQHLKRRGVITFDPVAQCWRKVAAGSGTPMPSGTTIQLPMHAPAQPVLPTGTPQFDPMPAEASYPLRQSIASLGRTLLSYVACFSLVLALIALNASFAWELGREAAQFQIAFVAALMALDLMRPFLVARGVALLGARRRCLGLFAICIALSLSPVSILSSTSILSASLLLGAEVNESADRQRQTLDALRAEQARHQADAEAAGRAWEAECARGGCGPLAEEHLADRRTAQAKAIEVLDQIVTLTGQSVETSPLLARFVTTFERLGLFGEARALLLPLLLALSLEIGALFGPALLLGRR